MEKTSTNHSLLNIKNFKNDELSELISLLNDNSHNNDEVFNYLNRLGKDVNEEKVQNILEFARQYRTKVHNGENAAIR